ncbi:MAG TPA: NAD(+) synthase [Clostridiaceae bacterium]|nr:NAD(+) synthase [Clostridiaceae bacterium]
MNKNIKIAEVVPDIVQWCRDQLSTSGGDQAVIGLSGGKDSTVVAALMAEAIGKEQVFGLILPDQGQNDLDTAIEIARELEINYQVLDISPITSAIRLQVAKAIESGLIAEESEQTRLNLPPRVRMTVLYAVSQSILGSRVVNTSNLSEDWVGYVTLYGDSAGAFAPLGMLTSAEVIALGEALGVSERFLKIPPADGLTGKTDEDVFGFSYEQLDKYIRTGEITDKNAREKIDRMHRLSRFKFQAMPMFQPHFDIGADDIAGIYDVD